MRIFVTVGHTRFDSLFKQLDKIERSDWHFVFQTYDGTYIPSNGEHIAYTNDIKSYFQSADVVVTHAGAGTVYSLLEMGKKTIVVSNSDRLDPHQEDLIRYVEDNKFAQVCRNLSLLEELLENVTDFVAEEYHTEPFHGANEISKTLGLID